MGSDRSTPPRVVILGAGFGGLWAARSLIAFPAEVTLIDAENYHMFVPLLYQIAAAELEPEDIAYPIRSIFRNSKNIRFVMGRATQIDFSKRTVSVPGYEIPFDFFVLAIGSASNFFGVPGVEAYAFPLKTLHQAIVLRNHILRCFERAEIEPDSQRRRQILTFAVVGGGPTGVEFAGALLELIRGPLRKDYQNIDFQEPRVILCHSGDRVIPTFPEKLSAYALRRLKKMGVEVRLRSRVTRITPEAAYHDKDVVIPTETVIWTAGVRGNPYMKDWGLPLMKTGQVKVLPTLQVENHPEVYCIGDAASFSKTGQPLPMLATVAIQQGIAAAQNIKMQIEGHQPLPFHFRDPGSMLTIGRNAAGAHVFGRNFNGFPAWILWIIVHLVKLIGFRNRLFVLINWALDYFFYERTVRLILPDEYTQIEQRR